MSISNDKFMTEIVGPSIQQLIGRYGVDTRKFLIKFNNSLNKSCYVITIDYNSAVMVENIDFPLMSLVSNDYSILIHTINNMCCKIRNVKMPILPLILIPSVPKSLDNQKIAVKLVKNGVLDVNQAKPLLFDDKIKELSKEMVKDIEKAIGEEEFDPNEEIDTIKIPIYLVTLTHHHLTHQRNQIRNQINHQHSARIKELLILIIDRQEQFS